jgi:hypothetical protein
MMTRAQNSIWLFKILLFRLIEELSVLYVLHVIEMFYIPALKG